MDFPDPTDPIAAVGLRRVINARGTFTPLGVSRSSAAVASATGEALRHFFPMADLHDRAGRVIADWAGAEAAALCHCAAAAITIACAAAMAGTDTDRVAQLPGTQGMKSRIVLQAGHSVNYGHPIEQAVRLLGAQVVVAGSATRCTTDDLDAALHGDGVAALLLVDSRLCTGAMVPHAEAAAQDLRMADVLAFGADLTIFSAQKYLAAPTVGLVLGRCQSIAAFRAQETGIGRGMKVSKEAVFGLLAAVRERDAVNLAVWQRSKAEEAAEFAAALDSLAGVAAWTVADPTRGPFQRVEAEIGAAPSGRSAADVTRDPAAGDPAIFVYDAEAARGRLGFELPR